MKRNRLFLIPLSVALLASCGGGTSSTPTTSESSGTTSGDTSVSSSVAPSISDSTGGGATSDSDSGEPIDPSEVFNGIVRIYFHNDTGTEKTKRIYVWCDGVDGTEFDWTGYDKDIGAYYDVDITQAPYAGHVAGRLSFIVKEPGTWAGQSADTVVKFADYVSAATRSESGLPQINVYSCPGEGNLIETYVDKTDALGDSFKSVAATDWKTLTVTGGGTNGGVINSYTLYCFDETFLRYNDLNKAEHLHEYIIAQGEPKKATFTITVKNGIDPQKTYRIEGYFASNPNKKKKKVATFDKLYDTTEFKSNFTYSGNDLGIKYSAAKTEFRLWAPTSTMVRLNIYTTGTPAAYTDDPAAHAFNDFPLYTYYLAPQKGGIFTGTVEKDLKGYYYTYTLFYGEGAYETVDPYATACGVNGIRGAIVDFSDTNPTGWDKLSFKTKAPQPNYLSVYEVHVRDFTADETWVSKKGNANGTYNAFVEEGTVYGKVSTGFDHLKELGVNAVQLLPVYDQDNDERTIVTQENGQEIVTKPGYNWGYNPQNYNCVEGSYASDPYEAEVRIKEYKNLIKKLADNDMRVIMDVVYNHVASVTKNAFSIVCPRYFFRYDANQNLIDDSGVGNCTNTDRPMMSKFVVDSCAFWAKEYKVKGFRFDLMGVLDTGTMRKVKDALYDIDPEIVVYGEGWTGGSKSASSPADTDNTYKLLTDKGKGSVGLFNDCGRDGTKGNTAYGNVTPSPNHESFLGRGDKNADMVDQVYNCLTQIMGQNRWKKEAGIATAANQTVNYVACHDNYTLYDQLNYMYNGADKCLQDSSKAMYAAQAAMGYVEFSQGIAFLHGGDEFFRTKVIDRDDEFFDDMVESYKYGRYNQSTKKTDYSPTPFPQEAGYSYWIEGDGIKIDKDHWLVRNSYKYGDKVNAFDWARKAKYNTLYEGIKNLVQTRKALTGDVLGMKQADIDKEKTYCWSYDDLCGETSGDLPILAGGASSKGGVPYYAILGGNCSGMPSIGIGNGTFEIVYANKYHSIGDRFTVTNNKIAVEPFEFLIVKTVG